MTLKREAIGPFRIVYVGKEAPSLDPFIRLTATRCKGGSLEYTLPEEFDAYEGNSDQAGTPNTGVDLSFKGASDPIMALSMGNPVDEPGDPCRPSELAKYALLLVFLPETEKQSIYIPNCYTKKHFKIPYSKREERIVDLEFEAYNRNRFVQQFYKDTFENLLLLPNISSRIP